MWHDKPQAGEEINVKVNHARLGIWISIIVPGGPAVAWGPVGRGARRGVSRGPSAVAWCSLPTYLPTYD